MKMKGTVVDICTLFGRRVVEIHFPFAEELYRELRIESSSAQIGDMVELEIYSLRIPVARSA